MADESEAVKNAVEYIVSGIRKKLEKEGTKIEKATDVIVVSMEFAEKFSELKSGKDRARAVYEALSKQETLELLPTRAADQLRRLFDADLMNPLMTLVSDAAKRRFDINRPEDVPDKVFKAFKSCCGGG